MSTLERSTRIAPNVLAWRRFYHAATGLSFEAPLKLVAEPAEGPLDALAEGRMTLPFVFDVTFMASRETSDASPEALARDMAVQWAVDYDLVSRPSVRRVACPGIEEAWSLRAGIRDDAGTIDHSWMVLRKDGKVGCLGVSCWSAECLGREAWLRTLGSVSGDSPA